MCNGSGGADSTSVTTTNATNIKSAGASSTGTSTSVSSVPTNVTEPGPATVIFEGSAFRINKLNCSVLGLVVVLTAMAMRA